MYSSRFRLEFKFVDNKPNHSDPSGRAVSAMGMRPLACWDCRFESNRGHGCLFVRECCVFSGRGLLVGLITRPEV